MMKVQLQLISTACIVYFGLTPAKTQNQVADQAFTGRIIDDGSETQQNNFQNLFDSIAKNDTKKREISDHTLKHQLSKEQQVFDVMRGELQTAQNKKRNFHEKIQTNEHRISVKRETNREDENNTVISSVKRFDVGDMSPCNYLYMQIKRCSPEMTNPSESEAETTEMKEDICIGIMKSEWMVYKRNLDAIEQHGEALYEELRANHSNIYADYSSIARRANLYRPRIITAYNDESLEHEIEEMETFDMQEHAFSCLARNRETGKIEQYFISREYDLGKCVGKIKNIMAVFIRFVFGFVEKRGVIPVAFTDDRLENYRLEPDE